MKLTPEQLAGLAAESGFERNNLEKVLRLIDLLNSIRAHPYLKERVVLKGGTALNLFLFPLPRLSVDIDLNYIGADDRETMLEERPKIEQAVKAVCAREGYTVRRMPEEHAGGKWRLSYQTVDDRPGTLELDINLIMRVPLWTPQALDSIEVGPFRATRIPLLDVHELAAGKLAALMDRTAGRDLFDVRELLSRDDIEHASLRLAFVVYGGISRRDWRTVRIEDVRADSAEVARRVVPLLRAEHAPDREALNTWSESLQRECQDLLAAVLPLRTHEIEFLDRLNGRGQIEPSMLTSDLDLQDRIARQPGLLWKALNVRKHVGSESDADE